MNTRELMIGNLIQIEGCPVEVIKIFEIHLEVHSNIFQFWSVEIVEVEPIPLTEEWLIKLGGERKSQYAVGVGVYHTIIFDKLILLKNIKDEFYACNCAFSPVIKYVHQLQNLYFSLTQTELTIKDL